MVEMQSARLKRAGVARHLLEARDFSRVRLHNNPLVYDMVEYTDQFGTPHRYIVFNNDKIIQFQNDDLSDYRGNFNGLPADVAKELFHLPWNIQFCTKDLNEE